MRGACGDGCIGKECDVARDDLLAELHRTYDSTTIDDMAPYFFDEGKPFEEFMNRNSVRPDSFRYARDHSLAEIRYAVMNFGLSRCVFVTWTDDGVSFRIDEGDICTDYLGDRLD